jgi:DNA-binding MarR family transcriptional regulator
VAVTREKSRANGLDLGGLDALMGFHLRCAQVAAFESFKDYLRPYALSPGQLGTMYLIAANPNATQSAIADALLFDRSTMVQIIDQLEARALVVREPSANDRRSHALRLTAHGSTLVAELAEIVRRHEAQIAQALSAEERRTLIRLLARVHTAPL